MGSFVNGLQSGGWDWRELYSGRLAPGVHQLTIAGREDGAAIDKFCVTTNPEPPTGIGGTTTPVAAPLSCSLPAASVELYSLAGVRLTAHQTATPCIEILRSADGTVLSRKTVVR